MSKKFLFLYLNTGGGHKSAANVLSKIFKSEYPDVEVSIENAFDNHNLFGVIFFEKLYHVSQNFMPGLFSLFYRLGMYRWFQTLVSSLLQFNTTDYLCSKIKEKNPTEIVSFHFGIMHSLVSAVRKVNPKIKITVVVTDPFTVPAPWFYEKNVNYLVFSERAKDDAVNKYKICPEKIAVVPFLLNPKFRELPSPEQVVALKKKHNLPLDKKIVLLTGGGEGLAIMSKIVNEFILDKVNFSIIAVCGRDITEKYYLDILSKTQKHIDIHVFGFVDFMDELVACCDCAVIKAGPATLMEFLVSKKPVVICHFIYGQEVGNVEFAIENKVGTFMRSPKKIAKAVEKMLSDDSYLINMRTRFDSIPISTESEKIADVLMAK